MLLALAMLSENKEHMAGNHIYNIRRNCRLFAQSLQFSPKFEAQVSNAFIDCIEMASGLHDIGKIRIPDEILLKPGALDEEEIQIVRQHPVMGADMLRNIYSVILYNCQFFIHICYDAWCFFEVNICFIAGGGLYYKKIIILSGFNYEKSCSLP